VNERLQKILARAGHGSRRSAEALIISGRVRVNGVVVHALGAQADPACDRIEVDGLRIAGAVERVYLAMHKPAGYITTARDTHGRRTVMTLLPPDLPPHVLPVGRLDLGTEGLLLFTNDGEFAHRLAHPRYAVEKEYYAMVSGAPSGDALRLLRSGVVIDGKRTAPAQVTVARAPRGHAAREGHTWLRFVIHEGRKRQVRLMGAAVGHQVRTLVRTRVGDVHLGGLAPGATRPLRRAELDAMRRRVGL
jgi:23S rRNA pseudouridine2605 synthase